MSMDDILGDIFTAPAMPKALGFGNRNNCRVKISDSPVVGGRGARRLEGG